MKPGIQFTLDADTDTLTTDITGVPDTLRGGLAVGVALLAGALFSVGLGDDPIAVEIIENYRAGAERAIEQAGV